MPPPPRNAIDGGSLDREGQVLDRIAHLQGVVNTANGDLVDLIAEAIEAGWCEASQLRPADWVALRFGIAPGQAGGIARIAKRRDELPYTVAALRAGELTVDQAVEIARYVPEAFEESAARVASTMTVVQLRKALPHYSDRKTGGSRKQRRDIATGYDDQGWWISGRLPEAEGAVVDEMLAARREQLRRQARAETPEGENPPGVTLADALVAAAEAELQASEAAHPGADRYFVHLHLQAGLSGPELMTHLGIPLPDSQRRRLLCDARLRATLHEGTTPIAQGRTHRIIGRRLRRLVEHRDGGCAVPGCHRTRDLQIHHIWHWEDGGPTETGNLLTLCAFHHARHHDGKLQIDGNADLPRHIGDGVVFRDADGRLLDPTGTPVAPARGQTTTEAARCLGLPEPRFLPPTGERLDRSGFHLQRNPPDPPVEPARSPAEVAAAEACRWNRREQQIEQQATGRIAPHPADPTRAGPTA